MENVEFCKSASIVSASNNGSHVTLSQHLLGFSFRLYLNHIAEEVAMTVCTCLNNSPLYSIYRVNERTLLLATTNSGIDRCRQTWFLIVNRARHKNSAAVSE